MNATLERPAARTLRPLDFNLPPDLEARVPPEARGLARDEVRLLVTNRDGDRVDHASFRDLPCYVDPGDLIVVNDSATLPAALTATRRDGIEFALHLSTRQAPDRWVVEPREMQVAAGETVALRGAAGARFVSPYRGSKRLWLAQLDLPQPFVDYLHRYGRPISYKYVDTVWPISSYQNVYARVPGSAEMPSAGRPFSHRVTDWLRERGVGIATITLHTGVASLEDHEPPYDEWFDVPDATARAIASARASGRRVVAVGTTVVRALESATDASGVVGAARGWTDLIVTPERPPRAIDALITGFHEPRASHLAMLEAIAGRRHLELAYAAALSGRYLWHEFGDVHLIL